MSGDEAAMAKIGRNHPCPCSSGKKYKHCCLEKDQAARSQALEHAAPRDLGPGPPGFFFAGDDLDRLSNRVVHLIHEGRLDEAQTACDELKAEYPEAIDWIERTAMLHEARGQIREAIEHYERTIQHMDDNPEDFEELSREPARRAIARLRREL